MTRMRWILCCFLLAACGSSAKKSTMGGTGPTPEGAAAEPVAAPPPTPTEVLAVVPVTKGKYVKLAAALDEAMQAANPPGVTRKVAGTPLDVAQLSIECLDVTPECHAGLAKSLEANQVLMARVGQGATRGQVRVDVLRTDASGATLGSASGTYKTEADAVAEAAALVTQALGASPGEVKSTP